MTVPASVASRPTPTIVITSAFLGRPAGQRISKASSDNASYTGHRHRDEREVRLEAVTLSRGGLPIDKEAVRPVDLGNGASHHTDDCQGRQACEQAQHKADAAKQLQKARGVSDRKR
jgi:hypothetical protein